jgi:hypothetical protein
MRNDTIGPHAKAPVDNPTALGRSSCPGLILVR